MPFPTLFLLTTGQMLLMCSLQGFERCRYSPHIHFRVDLELGYVYEIHEARLVRVNRIRASWSHFEAVMLGLYAGIPSQSCGMPLIKA